MCYHNSLESVILIVSIPVFVYQTCINLYVANDVLLKIYYSSAYLHICYQIFVSQNVQYTNEEQNHPTLSHTASMDMQVIIIVNMNLYLMVIARVIALLKQV